MKSSVLLAILPAAVLAYSDIKDGALKSHNQYRTEHAAPALKWNEDAARAAQAHADKCQYGHSNNNEYGENIAAGYDSIEKAVTAWGDEREKYNFGNQGFSSECGHFTQIVWKDTTTVGCGAALCDGLLGSGKQWFHVCNYHTAGNVEGQYEKNVSPKTNGYKQKPVEEDDDKKSRPSKKPKFEYEDKPTKKPSYTAEPDYETDNDVYSDNDTDSDEYDSDNSDDYSGKKWKPFHKKWNSRNKWNPYKYNKYSKYNKWNSKKWSPKKKYGYPKKHYGYPKKHYGFSKKHDSGKYDSGKWDNDNDNDSYSSRKSDSYDDGKWDNGKYDSY